MEPTVNIGRFCVMPYRIPLHETDDIYVGLQPKVTQNYINPMEFADVQCQKCIFGYIRQNYLFYSKFPSVILSICLDYYCHHLLLIKNYHNIPLLKQLKSFKIPLNDIKYMVNKTQYRKNITLYAAMILIQQYEMRNNNYISGLNAYNKWGQYLNNQQLKKVQLIFGYNRKYGTNDLPKFVNHLCLLFYDVSNDKISWNAQEVSEWVGSLGTAYQQYMILFVDNGIDGEFMMELDDDTLEEIIQSGLHRKIILSRWKAF